MILKNTDKTEVRITMQTLSEGERLTHSYNGTLVSKNKKTYLNYNDGTEPCSLISDGNILRLCRLNSGTRLVFEKKARHPSLYHTPMGNISITVYTELMSDRLLNDGTVYIKYRLYIDQEAYVKNEISITVEEI